MEKIVAKALLEIKAVFFRPDEPFTWASGIKSPVYCLRSAIAQVIIHFHAPLPALSSADYLHCFRCL